jgi:hypothetical protein
VYGTISRDVQQIELPIVWTGALLENSSRTGFTIYMEGGEWSTRNIGNWLSLSHARQENVRCVMGYIVNLIVILDEMFRTAANNVTEDAALMVMKTFVGSGRRDSIHEDIRSFVTETFLNRFDSDRDLVLEKIIDLIRQYCPPSL